MTFIALTAFVLIFIGELGDKSQLLALILATKYKTWQVLVGITTATFTVHFVTALFGQWIGSAIPSGVMPWVSGVLFIGFGIWTLRGDKVDEDDAEKGGASAYGPILAIFIAFFISELGDKTQLMTLAIAADPSAALNAYLHVFGSGIGAWMRDLGIKAVEVTRAHQFWAVTLGSTFGMVAADAIAIFIGRILGEKLPQKLISRISGCIFIVFGAFSIGSMFF